MKKEGSDRNMYKAPKLVEYGDIRKLTAAATGQPGGLDSQYYLGYMNNLDGAYDQSFSA